MLCNNDDVDLMVHVVIRPVVIRSMAPTLTLRKRTASQLLQGVQGSIEYGRRCFQHRLLLSSHPTSYEHTFRWAVDCGCDDVEVGF